MSSGKLFVVGTPIGNLSDLTYRAVETLREVDFVAAEDTRVTGKLLNYLEIKKPLVSYYEHNAKQSGEMIVSRLISGENCAIVTDAGMPCISDPGEDLVKLCVENNIEVVVIPGPSAVVSALAISGLATSRFSFQGFLSTNKKNRYEHLASIERHTETLIFYEAPHKLVNTLEDFYKFFGDRKISLCRELTKVFEQAIRITLSKALEYYKEKTPKGEFVLVLEGYKESENSEELTLESAMEQVMILVDKGMRPVDACKQIAKGTNFSKGELYTKYIADNM